MSYKETLQAKISLKDKIIEAVKNGNHSYSEIISAVNCGNPNLMCEIEILENIYIFRVEPPDAPVTSWFEKKPKGQIVRGDDGRLNELPPVIKPKVKFIQPEISVAPILPETLKSAEELCEIPISRIVPNLLNPRGLVNTNEPGFENLVDSVRQYGIQQAVIVTPQPDGKFRIVMGHRRTKAAEIAGLQTAPCIIRQFGSVEAEEDLMLIENIQRKNLSPMQQARAFYRRYKTLGKDIHALARALSLNQSYLSSAMSLLKLDESLQTLVEQRRLSPGNAKILARLEKPEQIKLASRAVSLTGKDLIELVMQTKKREQGIKPPRVQWENKNRVTTDDEQFTRSWSLKELDKLGKTYYTAKFLRDSFDDVCQDACAENGNESLCHSCPVPRLIASLTRRTVRGETNG